MDGAAVAPRFFPGTLDYRGTRASTGLVSLEGTVVTYRPRRRVLSQNLRKYRVPDPHSTERSLRTRRGNGGRSELTSDMIVVGERACHNVTRAFGTFLPPNHLRSTGKRGLGMTNDRKGRRRSDYGYLLTYRTRWLVVLAKVMALYGELSRPISGATTTNIRT